MKRCSAAPPLAAVESRDGAPPFGDRSQSMSPGIGAPPFGDPVPGPWAPPGPKQDPEFTQGWVPMGVQSQGEPIGSHGRGRPLVTNRSESGLQDHVAVDDASVHIAPGPLAERPFAHSAGPDRQQLRASRRAGHRTTVGQQGQHHTTTPLLKHQNAPCTTITRPPPQAGPPPQAHDRSHTRAHAQSHTSTLSTNMSQKPGYGTVDTSRKGGLRGSVVPTKWHDYPEPPGHTTGHSNHPEFVTPFGAAGGEGNSPTNTELAPWGRTPWGGTAMQAMGPTTRDWTMARESAHGPYNGQIAHHIFAPLAVARARRRCSGDGQGSRPDNIATAESRTAGSAKPGNPGAQHTARPT